MGARRQVCFLARLARAAQSWRHASGREPRATREAESRGVGRQLIRVSSPGTVPHAHCRARARAQARGQCTAPSAALARASAYAVSDLAVHVVAESAADHWIGREDLGRTGWMRRGERAFACVRGGGTAHVTAHTTVDFGTRPQQACETLAHASRPAGSVLC